MIGQMEKWKFRKLDNLTAIIFDMDGVLLDSEQIYRRASILAAKQLGFTMEEETYIATIGVTDEIAAKIITQQMGKNFPFANFEKIWRQIVAREMEQNIPLKKGVRQLLNLLANHNVPIGLVTSTSYDRTHKYLQKTDLKKFFHSIICGDEVKNGKPHPEPYFKVAQNLGVNPHFCLAVEDSYNGVRSAYRAGMKVVMVPDILQPNEEIEKFTHAILPSISHLQKILHPYLGSNSYHYNYSE